jgi:hypothetical protein
MLEKWVKGCDLAHKIDDFGRVITLQYSGILAIFAAMRRARPDVRRARLITQRALLKARFLRLAS